MKKYLMILILSVFGLSTVSAQYSYKIEGMCGEDVHWSFDGNSLVIANVNKKGGVVKMADYNVAHNVAPWVKKKLDVKAVVIMNGIKNIGTCPFANLRNLMEVRFEGTDLETIGWGAFLNCTHLRNISIPIQTKSIETIAFANCVSLPSIVIPDRCRLADQAFVSCNNLKMIDVAPTAIIGHHTFAQEISLNGKKRHALYEGEIRRLPSYVNLGNCHEFGFSKEAVDKCANKVMVDADYDYATSAVDTIIPQGNKTRYDTYALIIGNQNYRFVSDVPYAIHDARVFAEYCKKTLGIPVENIHIAEDATKQMILEEELEDWVGQIANREEKKLIVYYAGHGVPDTKNKNKAYILPTDVRGTSPKRGIALDAFYGKLGDLAFAQTSVFLDACFSGVNRDNEGVTDGLRAVEIEAEDATFGEGSVVVFTAAQGNETAQAYPEEGHGLFTYYLLKELQSTQGYANYGDMADHIKSNVSLQAQQMKLRKKQTPATNCSEKVSSVWRDMSF
jgi:hypothetical protein